MIDVDKLRDAVADLEEDVVYELLDEIMVNNGGDVNEALAACQEGMNIVGERFEQGEYFVGDLIFSGEIMAQAMDIIRPALVAEKGGKTTKMILCTVKGDLHDIGKNIVKAFFEAGGFEVVDLGIDVAPETIVETAKREGITIVALSGVLTLAIDAMKATIESFKDAGMRNDVRIIVGGAPVSADVCKLIDADAWADNPQTGCNICRSWVGVN